MASAWVTPEPEGIVRVVVCEEHALFRRGMIVALERDPHVEVVAELASADDLDSSDVTCDVVLLDITGSLRPIGETVAQVLRRLPLALVVLAVPDESDPATYDALRHGAAGILHKDIAIATAAPALRAVQAGNVLLTTFLATRVLAEYGELAPRARAGEDVPTLTEDEHRLLTLIADGSPATAVAVAARLPAVTARNLVRNAVVKLQRQVAADATVTTA